MTTLVQDQKPYEGKMIKFLKGNCKLLTDPSTKEPKTYEKKDGTIKSFKTVGIEILLPSGKKMTVPASLHSKTEQRMAESNNEFKVGSSYFTQIVPATGKDGKPTLFARISHFESNSFDADAVYAEFEGLGADLEDSVATEDNPKVAVEA